MKRNPARVGLAMVCLLATAWMAGAAMSPVTTDLVVDEPDRMVVHYEFGDYRSRQVVINGQAYEALLLSGEPLTNELGAPEVPYVSDSLIIPDNAEMAVTVVGQRYYEIPAAIVPSKGVISRDIDPATVPYQFGDAYTTDAFYPGVVAELGSPYILRDHRGAVVRVNPFQYNPVTGVLRVYTEVTVEVTTVGPGQVNVLTRPMRARALSRAFHEVYGAHFLNYTLDSRYAPLDEQGDMLIICHDAWIPNIQPFADHKNAAGINTTVVGVSTIGNSHAAIAAYIQSVYDTSDLAFVLLVGDLAQVTVATTQGGSGNSGPGDPVYAKVAGGDAYPDIMLGRFSASTAAHVDTQVARTIDYENMPATQQDWFWKGTGIGSAEGAGIGDEGQSDTQHINEIRGWLLANGYTQVDQIYDPGATAAQVSAALNDGRGVLNYCGHGYEFGLSTTGFDTGDIASLTNDNMLPFMFLVACEPGSIDETECFAEAAMRATNGGQPTGAIACYASSTLHPWAEPMEAQDEFGLLLTDPAEPYHTIGALCYAGSCSMIDDYPSVGALTFNTWLLFGDPSLRVIGTITPPHGLAVSPGTGLAAEGQHGGPFSPNSIDYTLENLDDSPLTYSVSATQAWVTVTNGSGTIPASGSALVTVEINAAANTLGDGDYSDTITFVNETNHDGDTTREVTLTVGVPGVQYQWTFDSDPGWSMQGQWAFGQPMGLGGSHGFADPNCGASGTNVCGVNLNGDYSLTTGGPYYLTLGPIDLSDVTDVSLRFQRWLNTDYEPYVVCTLDVSRGSDIWTTLWTNGGSEIVENDWSAQEFDISSTADDQATVYVRWGYEVGNYAYAYSGWNIDDVEIWGLAAGGSEYAPGDVNCDGLLNNGDIDPFVLAVTDPATYVATYPQCDINLADCNGDTLVNNADIDAFLALLDGA